MKLFKWIFCIVLFTVAACSEQQSENLVIRLDKTSGINPKESKTLAELGWKASYISLETKEDVLIQEIDQLEESKDFFWIVTHSSKTIFKFDKQGNFISSIEKHGEGPEEYLSIHKLQIHEENEQIYIMDYFGRKMVIYDFQGNFVKSFQLPEDYSMMTFYLFKDKVYYTSLANSLAPDIQVQDPDTEQTDTLSIQNRVMGIEPFLGESFLYELNNELFVFHYFNDTVFQIRETLMPAYEVRFGKLLYAFEELELNEDFDFRKKADGPRAQLKDFFETGQYIFIFYTITEFRGERNKAFMAMYDKFTSVLYPHLNILSEEVPLISIKDGKHFTYSKISNSLLISKYPEELMTPEEAELSGMDPDNNPVIIRYSLN